MLLKYEYLDRLQFREAADEVDRLLVTYVGY